MALPGKSPEFTEEELCDRRCPHRKLIDDLPGSSPHRCTHPDVVHVRLLAQRSERPRWCPVLPPDERLDSLALCPSCSERFDTQHSNGWSLLKVENPSWCGLCQHFNIKRDSNTLTVEHTRGGVTWREVYSIGKEPRFEPFTLPNGKTVPHMVQTGALGFGGARHEIEWLDGRPNTITHNLWSAGAVHRGLWYAFPITARFKKEEDRATDRHD